MRDALSCGMTLNREPNLVVVAELDAQMDVSIVRRVALVYRGGADASIDRPAHVRAGSGIAWVGSRLAVVQDDANFVALIDVQTGVADCVTLPAGDGGLRQFDDARANKAFKNDFEALVAISLNSGTRLLAFGSGSTSRRENIAIVDVAGDGTSNVRVVHVPQFYSALRANAQFSGSELNIEGAALVGDNVRMFGRGNGAASDNAPAVNATCDVILDELLMYLEQPATAAVPMPANVTQYDVGDIDGIRLSFTDAITISMEWASACREPAVGDKSAVVADFPPTTTVLLYSAAAEASPDAVRDGEVLGSAIGIDEYANDRHTTRYAIVRSDTGAVARVKIEGVAAGTQAGQVFAVVDSDDHSKPCELLELRLQTALTGTRATHTVNV